MIPLFYHPPFFHSKMPLSARHSHASGNPDLCCVLDSRLRGNDIFKYGGSELFLNSLTPAFSYKEERACHEYRRVCPYDHPDQECKGEIVNHLTPKKVEGNQYQDSGRGCNDGAAKDVVNPVIDNGLDRVFAPPPEIFPDPVKHDHCVCQGIACQGQECGDDKEIDLFVQQKEYPDHGKDIMEC